MEEMDRLRERVNELLRRYSALQHENENLVKDQERMQAEVVRLRSFVQEAELQRLSQAVGDSLPDEASRAKYRSGLDDVIREIDQILATLHV